MAIVDLQCTMRPVTRLGFGVRAAQDPTKLSIKIAQINRSAHEQDPTHELKGNSNWVWCIVQETQGQPDRFLSGGQSETMSQAAAQAQLELNNYEERLARKIEGVTHLP